LHDTRFFVENELSLCFIFDRLLFLSRGAAIFSGVGLGRGVAISSVTVAGRLTCEINVTMLSTRFHRCERSEWVIDAITSIARNVSINSIAEVQLGLISGTKHIQEVNAENDSRI
jgi:hypothetical protein